MFGHTVEGNDGIDEDDDIEMQVQRPRAASNIHRHDSGADIEDDRPPPPTTDEKDLKTVKLGNTILIVLFIVGVVAGIINGVVQWIIGELSKAQAKVLMGTTAGPFYFMLTTAALAALSAHIIKAGGEPGTTGAGTAEVKALMVSDFHPTEFPKLVSFKIMVIRLLSLISGAGAGLSIGLAAPLTHATVCFAYWLMKFVPDFGELIDNPALLKQVFAASAAVGFGSVSDTPVGGLLFSIEVTSAYYLISNYWRSFMAATAGAVVYNLVLTVRNVEGRFMPIPTVVGPYHKSEFILYALLGVICGFAGLGYLKLQQSWFLLIKPYMVKYPLAIAAAVGAFTALMIFAVGAYNEHGVNVSIVLRDCIEAGKLNELQTYHNHVAPVGGLIASLLIRTILTPLGTTLRISAGILICMLAVGAQIGRILGQIVQAATPGTNIYVAGYAMVGAVSFASATTHTISAAVILIEMTGEIDMLLPCLIGAVIACGITKSRSLSLYDQGMVNKGLESFELLMQNTAGTRTVCLHCCSFHE
jgi:chloride channel 2